MQKKATTLIELIISITIAMLLMGSIGIFVSSGMQNLFLQQKSLGNMSDLTDFSSEINKSLHYAKGSGTTVSSGIVFKRDKEFDKGGFVYIGKTEIDNFFCGNPESEETKTKHIFIKNFIPFFEETETSIEQTLTGGVDKYISYQKEHKITKNGEIIIGKAIAGDEFQDGKNGTGIYLNSPTGMAIDNEGILYVSDTLNNRILYLSGSKIYKLLDFDDGLREPTGLYYSNSEKSLYISNSAAGEILKLSSDKSDLRNSIFSMSFSGKTIGDIGKIKIEFFKKDTKLNLTGNLNMSLNIISFPEKSTLDYLTGTTEINYYYNNFGEELTSSSTGTCSSNGTTIIKNFYIENDILKRKKKICEEITTTLMIPGIPPTTSYSGSIKTYTSNKKVDFSNTREYEIKLKNIKFSETNIIGNIYAKVTFYKLESDTWEEKYNRFFYLKTNGDEKLYTLGDNILEKVGEGKKYPNGIWGNSDSDFNEFDIENFNNYNIDNQNDIILKTPIKNLEIEKNSSNNLLNIILKYYRNYNCFNLGENEAKAKTFLIKKNLK